MLSLTTSIFVLASDSRSLPVSLTESDSVSFSTESSAVPLSTESLTKSSLASSLTESCCLIPCRLSH